MNFTLSRQLCVASLRKKKLWLAAAVILNLVPLCYFKYWNFILQSASDLLGFNYQASPEFLPLGISFFTFTQIAFLVDTFRDSEKRYDPISYLLFVTYFPHLIAGPIIHHKSVMPQILKPASFAMSHEKIARGLTLFVLGLSKKVLVADSLAPLVASTYDASHAPQFFEAWISSLSYTLQLYFDFSGYSDMAIGCSLLFSIQLPQNFNSPYKAKNIQDFWRRWHITLSQWLRDYVYIPLGGNRRGSWRTSMNLFLTFLIGGIWHGAGWTFVVWGAIHGGAIVIQRWFSGLWPRTNRIFAWFLTFLTAHIAWVFFRAPDLSTAKSVLAAMGGANGIILPARFEAVPGFAWAKDFGPWLGDLHKIYSSPNILALVFGALIISIAFPNSTLIANKLQPRAKWALALSIVTVAALIMINRRSEFLYFQF